MQPLVLILVLGAAQGVASAPDAPALDAPALASAARVLGASFTPAEVELMLPDVLERLRSFERLRALPLANDVPMALLFAPAWELPRGPLQRPLLALDAGGDAPARPDDLEALAWADIATLGSLLRARRVSCEELARTFLARLRRLDASLHCVVTLTEERALAAARTLDQELAQGRVRGPLHGIPWVAKDLLAVRGYPTTWGAEPFRAQLFDQDAAAVERLDEAGAVLIAKVSLGALAWGDVWYGGTTRNPWKPEQGSSGSSAGSAAAVVAGGATFALGTETWGSIVSPSDRCGASSLRPTFGRVSRHGAMTLCWSLDKIGPICRSAADASIVFAAIHGADPRDPSAVSMPFTPRALAPDLRVGVPTGAFGADDPALHVLEELAALGVELVDVELPDYPVDDMMIILAAEAGAAFDEFSRGVLDEELARQGRDAWPNVFRHAQLVPAVDYLRANRLRTLLVRDMQAVFERVDVIVHPSFAAELVTTTNLSGHPTCVAPAGFRADGTPFSISFTGPLFGEATLLALAAAWQASTPWEDRHPPP